MKKKILCSGHHEPLISQMKRSFVKFLIKTRKRGFKTTLFEITIQFFGITKKIFSLKTARQFVNFVFGVIKIGSLFLFCFFVSFVFLGLPFLSLAFFTDSFSVKKRCTWLFANYFFFAICIFLLELKGNKNFCFSTSDQLDTIYFHLSEKKRISRDDWLIISGHNKYQYYFVHIIAPLVGGLFAFVFPFLVRGENTDIYFTDILFMFESICVCPFLLLMFLKIYFGKKRFSQFMLFYEMEIGCRSKLFLCFCCLLTMVMVVHLLIAF